MRPPNSCSDTIEGGVVKIRACCSAVIPYKAEASERVWSLDTPGRKEVCIRSDDLTKYADVWEPVQFVEILEAKYNAMCIEGAMKAAAGAAAILGSIFMMQ